MTQNTLTTHVEQSKEALAALLKKLIGTELPLETESPEHSPQERSSALREEAADRFCLEAPEHGVLVALSLDWVPVVSEAMLGERLEPDSDGAADLMREFGSQAFGTVQSTLAAEGIELPSVEFETAGPETTPSVPTGPTWRVSFSADHEDTTLEGVVLMPSESNADDETSSDASASGSDESSSGSFTERASSSQQSSQQASSSASAESDSEVEVSPASFGEVGEEDLKGKEEVNNFGLLAEVDLEVRVELGRRELPLADVLKLTTGSVVELEKMVGEPLSVYANGRLIAEGEAVVIDEQFGVRITNLASEEARNKAFF